MTARLSALLCIALLALAWTGTLSRSYAADPTPANPSRLTIQPAAPTNPGTTASSSFIDQTWRWIVDQQRRLMGEMSAAVHRIHSDEPGTATIVLVVVSFVYGVIHAAGPGHGKFVVSSYALANARTLRRGVGLAFLSAFFQAISAIVLVSLLAVFFYATRMQAKAVAEAWLETGSWGLIALFGAWLVFRQVRPLTGASASGHGGHSGAGAHAHDGHVHRHQHEHGHDHPVHEHGPACHDHAHLPEPGQLEGDWSWRRAFALATSIGLRPCTGAIVVLFVATNIGLWWAGVLATFAMAFGTAITVSALAIAAVWSRGLAKRMAGTDGPWAGRIERYAGLAGAALVFLLGMTGFIASFAGTGLL